MFSNKFFFGVVVALALLINTGVWAIVEDLSSIDGFVSPDSITATSAVRTGVQTLPATTTGNVMTDPAGIDTETWPDPEWAPTATTTYESARPQASGFWSGSDPFPVIIPSTFSRTTSTGSNSGTTSSTASNASTSSISAIGRTSSSVAFVPVTSTTVQALSTSVSTHVTLVTASNSDTTSVVFTMEPTTSTSEGSQSSQGGKNIVGVWILAALAMVVQELL